MSEPVPQAASTTSTTSTRKESNYSISKALADILVFLGLAYVFILALNTMLAEPFLDTLPILGELTILQIFSI